MNKLSLTLWCQTYLLLALLAATVLSPLPYSPLALVLLLAILFVTFRPLPPRLNIVITMTTVSLLPLILEPLLNYVTQDTLLPLPALPFIAAATILPAIYLLDRALKQNAQGITPAYNNSRRSITHITRALAIAILMLVLISLILDHRVLLFTGVILALYLLITLARALQAIPGQPLDIPPIQKRIIAGGTADISLHATSRASIGLHCRLSPADPWVKITPSRFTLGRAKIKLNLSLTPPLAGPAYLQLQVSVIDPRGLLQINQITQPVRLHVIPRARYAEWLAKKYLEQARTGAMPATTLSSESAPIPKRGLEYFGSRNYQYGDQLRDIDWKHTLKLSRIIIKEYAGAGEPVAIIAVNLSATDAEAADKLAFNLVTTALTLARQTIPTALAAYDHEKVILTTAVTDPRETLKQTLQLVKDINLVEPTNRRLQPPDIGKLRRNIAHLKRATSAPAQRLLSILDFEYRAIEQAAKNHSATIALAQITRHTSPPAIIILVSQMSPDTEAPPAATEKLTRRGFTTLRIEEPAVLNHSSR